MKLDVDWHALGQLYKAEGLLPKENKVYTMLMTGGFMPEPTYNALAIFNHDYSVINNLEDWKKLVSVCRDSIPDDYSNYQWNNNIVNYLLKYASDKSFFPKILKEVFDSESQWYLTIFYRNHFSSFFYNYFDSLPSIKSEEDLDLLKRGMKVGWLKSEYLNKVNERIRKEFLFKAIEDNYYSMNYLHMIIQTIDPDTQEEWDRIFKGNLKKYEPNYVGHVQHKSFYKDILNDFFNKMIEADTVSKDDGYLLFGYLQSIFADCLNKKKPVDSLMFEVLKKTHSVMTVWHHENLIYLLRKNEKVNGTPDFEDYVKFLVAEETRAGVLKKLVTVLPKKQLPWLLSSEFKTVKDAVRRKLKA